MNKSHWKSYVNPVNGSFCFMGKRGWETVTEGNSRGDKGCERWIKRFSGQLEIMMLWRFINNVNTKK